MFDSVSTLVLISAWQYGHVKCCDSEPNCVFPMTMTSAKLLFNVRFLIHKKIFNIVIINNDETYLIKI